MNTDTKTCTRCNEEKPVKDFGRGARCRDCVSALNSEYYAANAERLKRRRREDRAAHGEKYRERDARQRAIHAEARKAHQAVYRVENLHVWWESDYRKRALRAGFDATVEHFTRGQLVDQWGDACHHCGGPFEELDHYPVPVSRGGAHSLDNCRPSCGPCNQESWRNPSGTTEAV